MRARDEIPVAKIINHPLSPLTRRAGIAILAVLLVMVVGTIGVKILTASSLTPYSWVYSFYFMSMIATAEGPPGAPPNDATSIFISIMAFISIGTLITAVGTIFGPFLGFLFHKGVMFAEKEFGTGKEKSKEDKSSPSNATT